MIVHIAEIMSGNSPGSNSGTRMSGLVLWEMWTRLVYLLLYWFTFTAFYTSMMTH